MFTNDTDSNVTGSLPRINFSRAEKAIGTAARSISARRPSTSTSSAPASTDAETNDSGLTRIDFSPTMRFPFTKLPFLTFNSSVRLPRDLLDARAWTTTGAQVPDGIQRRYFTCSPRLPGRCSRSIFNTPRQHLRAEVQARHRADASRFSARRAIDNREPHHPARGHRPGRRRRHRVDLRRQQPALREERERAGDRHRLVAADLLHRRRRVDGRPQYQSSSYDPGGLQPTQLLAGRAAGARQPDHVDRRDRPHRIRHAHHALRTLRRQRRRSRTAGSRQHAGWSLTATSPAATSATRRSRRTHFLNASTIVRKPGNAFSGSYAFNSTCGTSEFVNQRIIAHYNTQCCGIAVEYQKFNFGTRRRRGRRAEGSPLQPLLHARRASARSPISSARSADSRDVR